MAYRIAFMGSDPIALPALEAIAAGNCGPIELVAVYTQPDRARGRGKKVAPNAIKAWAVQRGIEARQPERMKRDQRLEIAAMELDAILVMAFGHLLSQKLIDTPRLGIWNLHTSLLPKYRGASPIQCAVASGETETGVSLMRLVREMDAGPVLDAERVGIEALDTAVEVEAKLSAACVPLLERNVPKILAGEARPVPQDAAAASYVRKLGKDDGQLDFGVSATELACRINGLHPWPGARFEWEGVAVKVGLAAVAAEPAAGRPGEILGCDAQGLGVACGEGAVLLKRLQRPGGKMMAAADFCRGFPLEPGRVIESRPMPKLVSGEPL